jgi:hypothetical protein
LQKKREQITAAEMKFVKQTGGYTHTDHKKNSDIMKVLKTEPIMNLQTYRANWKCHVLRMPCSRIPFQMLHCQPKGKISTGRPFKRCHETVTGHFHLKHVVIMIMIMMTTMTMMMMMKVVLNYCKYL